MTKLDAIELIHIESIAKFSSECQAQLGVNKIAKKHEKCLFAYEMSFIQCLTKIIIYLNVLFNQQCTAEKHQ